MKEYDFDYTLYPDNSTTVFKAACSSIEKHFENAEKMDLLIDVDGTTIQRYYINNKKVVVYDDYDVGAVYVLSDVDLSAAIKEHDFSQNEKEIKTA